MKNHNVIRNRFPDGHIYNKIPLGEGDEMVEANGNLVVSPGILIIQASLMGRGT